MDDYAAITEKCREFLKEPEGRTIWDWAKIVFGDGIFADLS